MRISGSRNLPFYEENRQNNYYESPGTVTEDTDKNQAHQVN